MVTLQLTLDNGQITVRANEIQSHTFPLHDLNVDLKNFVKDPRPYGGKLFQALFKDSSEARKMFDELSKQAERTIVLVLESSELDGIAWEYAYHDNAYIVEDFAFIRALPEKERPHANGRFSRSVERMPLLFIPANPLVDLSGEPMRELDIESEWKKVKQFVEKSNAPFDLIELRPATPAALQSVMARFKNGMIAHFSGHGAATKDGAFLLFENENGSSNPLEAREFVREVKDQAWIGFLSACQSAVAERTAYSNLARELVKAGGPFALGMQFNLPDPFADDISGQFYNYLSQGHAVPEAARQARRALKRENEFYVGMIALYAAHPDEAGKMEWTGSDARTLSNFAEADVSDLPTPSGFIGRQRELMNIGTSLLGKKKPNTVTLHGAGGIGKTSLMRQALLRFAPLFEASLAIALDPLPSLESVLGRLERFLNLPSPCLNDTKEREKIVREKLTGRATLLGLDNFETLIHARDNGSDEEKKTAKSLYAFFKSLAAEGVTLCVTSREKTSLPGETIQEIHGLENEVGGRLFQNTVSTRRDALTEAGLEKISASVGGHPLALRLLAPIFEEQAGLTLDDFIQKLQTFLPKAHDEWTEQERHESLGACFAFSMDNLPKTVEGENLQIAISRLSVFIAFFVDTIAAPVLENNFPESQEEYMQMLPKANNLLHALWERGLLERAAILLPDENFYLYRLHPAIGVFAREHMTDAETIEDNYRKSMSHFAGIAEEELSKNPLVAQIALRAVPDLLNAAGSRNDKDAALMQYRVSILLQQFGLHDDALRLLEKSRDINQSLNDMKSTSFTMIEIAGIYAMRGDVNGAMQLYQQSLEILETLGDIGTSGKSKTIHAMAIIYVIRGKYESAMELYLQALEISEKLGDLQGKASTSMMMAEINIRRGDFDGAMKLYRQAQEFFEVSGDLQGKAKTFTMMAQIYYERGDLDGAMNLYQQARQVFEGLGDLVSKATVTRWIALIESTKGNLDTALALNQETLVIANKLGDADGKSSSLHQMAEIFARRGDLEMAMQLHQQALEVSEKTGNLRSKSVTLHAMAGIYVGQRNLDKAMQLYQQSLEIKETLGDLHGKASTLAMISQIYAIQKDYKESLGMLLSAMGIAQKIGAKLSIVNYVNNIKKIQSVMGFDKFEILWKELTGQALPQWLSQSPKRKQGMTVEQFIVGAIQSVREKRPETDQYFKEAQRMTIDSNATAELQSLGKILQRILIGQKNVDLSTLTDEFREIVEKALAG